VKNAWLHSRRLVSSQLRREPSAEADTRIPILHA